MDNDEAGFKGSSGTGELLQAEIGLLKAEQLEEARFALEAVRRGGHLHIHWEIIESVEWRSLGYSSQSLFLLMRRKLMGTNNGNISATLGELKHYGWKSSATLNKALKELQALGFIAVTRQGGIAFGQKVCTLYRFTDVDVYEHLMLGIEATPATNEWKRFSTLAGG